MKNIFEYVRTFFAKLYAYIDGPAEFAGLAMFVAITVITSKELLSGWQIVVAYAVAVGVYIGMRPTRVGPDGADFTDGGDDE